MRLGWFLVLASALVGCRTPERGPNLVEIDEVRPRHVEVGDRLRLLGSGFPEGRVGEVTLRGDLHRAGEAPERDVEIAGRAELVSPHALELPVTRELAEKLCGGADARHTTFRGDVEVAFAPRASGGSKVRGRLEGVVVDVTPEAQAPSAIAALRAQGERFGLFLGLGLTLSDEGLVASEVEAQSRAARAGVVPGDVLVELDGVVLRGLSDFVPVANARSSPLFVRRGVDVVPLRVESAGFRYSAPDALAAAVALLGVALTAFLLFWSPLGRVLGFFERRVTDRLRASAVARKVERVQARRVPRLVAELVQRLPSDFASYFGLVAASSLFTLLALGKSLVASELDLLVVPAATGFASFALAFLTGQSEGRFSLAAGARRALSLGVLGVPLAALLVTAALGAGSLRADDLVRAQGVWPWQWGLFQSPVLLVSGVLAFAALVPRARRVSVLDAELRPSARDRFHDLAQGVHELVSVGVLSVVLLGGWQLGAAGTAFVVSIAGALLLLTKTWAVLLALAFVRWALGGLDLRMLGAGVQMWLTLPALGCVGLAALFRRSVQSPVLVTLERGLGPVLFFAGFLAAVWFCARILQGVRTPGSEPGIQPWV